MNRRHIANRRSVLNRAMARLRGQTGGDEAAPSPTRPETYDATDAAAQLMAEKRINPFAVAGTGENGRILKPDVDRYIEENG